MEISSKLIILLVVSLMAISACQGFSVMPGGMQIPFPQPDPSIDLLAELRKDQAVVFSTTSQVDKYKVESSVDNMAFFLEAIRRRDGKLDEELSKLDETVDRLREICIFRKAKCKKIHCEIAKLKPKKSDPQKNLREYVKYCEQRQKDLCPDWKDKLIVFCGLAKDDDTLPYVPSNKAGTGPQIRIHPLLPPI